VRSRPLNDDNCDSNCHEIKVNKDAHGCEIKQCQRKNKCPVCWVKFGGKDACGCEICHISLSPQSVTPIFENQELVIQRRSSVDNERFNRVFSDYVSGFSNSQGDYWFGLEPLHKLTSAAKSRYQLVLSGKRTDNEKWMELVLDNFYVDSGNDYQLRFGSIVAKQNSVITESNLSHNRNQAFSAYDSTSNVCALSKKGGWWFGSPTNCFWFCLNCDQRSYEVWYETAKVPLSETKMSIRVKM